MRVLFAPEAKAEFDEGVRYYALQVPGLGKRFRDEVRDAAERIRCWPLSAPVERGEIRRQILSRFPYKLLYTVEVDHLYVIAVAHLHRAPGYWSERTAD